MELSHLGALHEVSYFYNNGCLMMLNNNYCGLMPIFTDGSWPRPSHYEEGHKFLALG